MRLNTSLTISRVSATGTDQIMSLFETNSELYYSRANNLALWACQLIPASTWTIVLEVIRACSTRSLRNSSFSNNQTLSKTICLKYLTPQTSSNNKSSMNKNLREAMSSSSNRIHLKGKILYNSIKKMDLSSIRTSN